MVTENINDKLLISSLQNKVRDLEKMLEGLEEVYEHVFGDDAINRYTHEELITMLDEMYDCYKYVVDNIYGKGKHIGDNL